MNCQNCGTAMPSGWKACGRCGAPVPAQPLFTAPNEVSAGRRRQASRWENPKLIILALVFCFPLGIYTMWKYAPWPKPVKWTVTIAYFVVCCALSA